jgi:hypothetical protein
MVGMHERQLNLPIFALKPSGSGLRRERDVLNLKVAKKFSIELHFEKSDL